MTREEVFEKLNVIFRDVFDDDDIIVDEATTSEDIDDWDSLEHINLMVAIERSFEIKLAMNETVKLKNVGDLADAILERIKNG